MKAEPVTTMGAVSAALVLTVNLVAYLLGWSAEVTTLVNGVVAAWLVVAAVVVRRRVAPEASVRAVDPTTADRLWPGSPASR